MRPSITTLTSLLVSASLLLTILITFASHSQAFLAARRKGRQKQVSPAVAIGQRARSSAEISAGLSGDEWGDFDAFSDDPNTRLAEYIRSRTRPYRRPVKHSHDLVEVHVRSSLYQIVDLDQRNNLATLSAYFDVWWMDAFIPWNASDFDGITHTFIPLRWIWRPEFYLYHSIQGRTPDYDGGAMVEVHNGGMVRLFVPVTSRALCPINVKYFPYDTQNCTFLIGSWSYQSNFVRLLVEDKDVFLGDFYDNQEWLLMDALISNGTMSYLANESFSMVQISLLLKRQSFYYVFNLVFPTTLVSLVAVIGFHAPINATGRRESKFRLGVMTLLSLSVMLLMLVDEMKFALESIPGQRGSFSDVPLIGIYYMSLILTISISTFTTSFFVHLEKYALRNPAFSAVPQSLRFLTGKSVFCCYAPRRVRLNKGEEVRRNKNVRMHQSSNHSSPDTTALRTLIPTELNFVEYQQRNAQQITNTDIVLEATSAHRQQPLETQKIDCKLDLLISLIRELLEIRRELRTKGQLPVYWERILRRLEICSLTFYLGIIALNLVMFLWPELWY